MTCAELHPKLANHFGEVLGDLGQVLRRSLDLIGARRKFCARRSVLAGFRCTQLHLASPFLRGTGLLTGSMWTSTMILERSSLWVRIALSIPTAVPTVCPPAATAP